MPYLIVELRLGDYESLKTLAIRERRKLEEIASILLEQAVRETWEKVEGGQGNSVENIGGD